MSRGTAKFTTGKPIDSQLSSDFSQPNYSKKLDPEMDFEGKNRNVKGSCEELDPIRAINKAFDNDDDMVVKTSTLNIRSEARNYNDADSDWRKHESAIRNERQAKLVPELKKNVGKIDENSMKRIGQLSKENTGLRNTVRNAEKKLTRGKLAAVTAIPLVASGIAGAYKYGQKKAEKGVSEVDNSIETKAFLKPISQSPILRKIRQIKENMNAPKQTELFGDIKPEPLKMAKRKSDSYDQPVKDATGPSKWNEFKEKNKKRALLAGIPAAGAYYLGSTGNSPTTKAAKFDNIADNHVKKPGMVSKIVDRLKTEE